MILFIKSILRMLASSWNVCLKSLETTKLSMKSWKYEQKFLGHSNYQTTVKLTRENKTVDFVKFNTYNDLWMRKFTFFPLPRSIYKYDVQIRYTNTIYKYVYKYEKIRIEFYRFTGLVLDQTEISIKAIIYRRSRAFSLILGLNCFLLITLKGGQLERLGVW